MLQFNLPTSNTTKTILRFSNWAKPRTVKRKPCVHPPSERPQPAGAAMKGYERWGMVLKIASYQEPIRSSLAPHSRSLEIWKVIHQTKHSDFSCGLDFSYHSFRHRYIVFWSVVDVILSTLGICLPFAKNTKITLPKTNIAHENRPSEKEIHLPTIHFQGPC